MDEGKLQVRGWKAGFQGQQLMPEVQGKGLHTGSFCALCQEGPNKWRPKFTGPEALVQLASVPQAIYVLETLSELIDIYFFKEHRVCAAC